jgi:hypothetical protein
MNKHKCPILGCTQVVVYDKLMCYHHWMDVPPKLRMLVYSHWCAGHPTPDYPAYRTRAIAAVEKLGVGI